MTSSSALTPLIALGFSLTACGDDVSCGEHGIVTSSEVRDGQMVCEGQRFVSSLHPLEDATGHGDGVLQFQFRFLHARKVRVCMADDDGENHQFLVLRDGNAVAATHNGRGPCPELDAEGTYVVRLFHEHPGKMDSSPDIVFVRLRPETDGPPTLLASTNECAECLAATGPFPKLADAIAVHGRTFHGVYGYFGMQAGAAVSGSLPAGGATCGYGLNPRAQPQGYSMVLGNGTASLECGAGTLAISDTWIIAGFAFSDDSWARDATILYSDIASDTRLPRIGAPGQRGVLQLDHTTLRGAHVNPYQAALGPLATKASDSKLYQTAWTALSTAPHQLVMSKANQIMLTDNLPLQFHKAQFTMETGASLTFTTEGSLDTAPRSFDGTSCRDTGLQHANFASLRRSEDLPVSFDNSEFSTCDLTGSTFDALSLQNTTFSGSSLSDTSFHGADLRNSQLTALRAMTNASFLRANLSGAVISSTVRNVGISFAAATLRGTRFDGMTLDSANFESANLTNAVWDKSNAINSTFTAATMDGADLSEAVLTNSDLSSARTDSGVILSSAKMAGARLIGIRFFGTVRLDSATLTNAHLQRAIICGGSISGADLDGADLTDALIPTSSNQYRLGSERINCFKVDRAGVRTTSATICPDAAPGPCTSDSRWTPASFVPQCSAGARGASGTACSTDCDCALLRCNQASRVCE